jgi:hypothetical protein
MTFSRSSCVCKVYSSPEVSAGLVYVWVCTGLVYTGVYTKPANTSGLEYTLHTQRYVDNGVQHAPRHRQADRKHDNTDFIQFIKPWSRSWKGSLSNCPLWFWLQLNCRLWLMFLTDCQLWFGLMTELLTTVEIRNMGQLSILVDF